MIPMMFLCWLAGAAWALWTVLPASKRVFDRTNARRAAEGESPMSPRLAAACIALLTVFGWPVVVVAFLLGLSQRHQ